MRSLLSCGLLCAALVAAAVLREEGHWPAKFIFVACAFAVGAFAGILLMIRDRLKGKKAELRPSKRDEQIDDAIETYHKYVDVPTDD